MLFACCSRRQEQDRDPFGPECRNHLAQECGLAGAGETGDIHHHIARSPQEASSAALVRASLYHRVLDLALAWDEGRALAPSILDCGQHLAFFLANTLGRDVAAFAVEPDEGGASRVRQGILEGDAASGSAQEVTH